jgi:hypothetical protein
MEGWGEWASTHGRRGRVAVAGERGLTLNGKPQDRPQGPEVGRGAGGVASQLFGGVVDPVGRRRPGAQVAAEGGQADPGQAGAAVGRDQDVAGAQVEVGQAGGVGRLQGVQQLQAELGDPADREGAVPGHQLVEGQGGVDQLGGHVHDAALDHHVVQADQAGMVELGGGPGLAGDPVPQRRLPGVGGIRQFGEAELLDGQVAAPGDLGGPPDHAGGAAAQRGVQRPAARDEPLGGLGGHGGD